MFKKMTAIVILLLGILVIVLGVCFRSAENNTASDFLAYYAGRGSSGNGIDAASLASITGGQRQTQQVLTEASRLVTVAIGIGILSLGLAKLAEAFSAPAPIRAAAPAPMAAMPAAAPAVPEGHGQVFDDSLPEL